MASVVQQLNPHWYDSGDDKSLYLQLISDEESDNKSRHVVEPVTFICFKPTDIGIDIRGS